MESNLRNTQTLELSGSGFSCAEMNELVIKMINDRINHHKIQYMKEWVGDHRTDRTSCRQKIAELEAKKNELSEVITKADQKALRVEILERIQLTSV